MNAQHAHGLRPAARRLVIGLARYLQANPHASDTPDGIGVWWLGGRSEPALVQEALDFLVEAGLVERLPATDGRARYRRTLQAGDFEAVARATLAVTESGRNPMRLQ
jgi:hypothetical protein